MAPHKVGVSSNGGMSRTGPDHVPFQGTVVRRTVRASYAALEVVTMNSGNGSDVATLARDELEAARTSCRLVVVIVQFHDNKQEQESIAGWPSHCRSSLRRLCKIGNLMSFRGRWMPSPSNTAQPTEAAEVRACQAHDNIVEESAVENGFFPQRFVVDPYIPKQSGSASPASFDGTSTEVTENEQTEPSNVAIESLGSSVQLVRSQCWDTATCQRIRTVFVNDRSSQQIPPARRKPKCLEAMECPEVLGNSARRIRECQKDPASRYHQSPNIRHATGGVTKRRQGEIVATFLAYVIRQRLSRDRLLPTFSDATVTNSSRTPITENELFGQSLEDSENDAVREFLSKGTGVIDAAGGAGFVSLALALMAIPSTIVDPRPTAGRLPGRDRKVLKRALRAAGVRAEAAAAFPGTEGHNDKIADEVMECESVVEERTDHKERTDKQKESPQAVDCADTPESAVLSGRAVPFSTLRAWFGSRPVGVDTQFREGGVDRTNVGVLPQQPNDCKCFCARHSGDEEGTLMSVGDAASLPVVCSLCNEGSSDHLLAKCSAIVGLHPDEATDAIVDVAVKHRIPFVVVPCCVFSRLFPNRYKPDLKGGGCGQRREIVSTYDDLIEYLVAKDPSNIRLSTLPFGGANVAVWSTFDGC